MRDYSYHGGGVQRTPFLDDLFFGAPVTEKIKRGLSYLKGKAKGVSNYFKGVSAGGEEFTYKLDKQLNPKKKKGEQSEPVLHPKFMHGKLSQVITQINETKPFLLYLSGGEDNISLRFESNILTRPETI
jgi:hypothetical protein